MELSFPKSSRVASRASRLVSQEVEKEQMTTDISGQKCLESLKSLSQGGLLAKMCEALLVSKTAWYSRQCALTWKVKVTKYKRSIFQLSASAHRTKENEFGLWRTPDAVSGGSNLPGIQKALDQGHLKRPSGQQIQVRLQDQVKEPRLWPTPKVSGQENLDTLIKRKGLRQATQHNLTAAAQMWPTPTQGMWKQDVNDKGEYAKRIQKKGNQIMLPAAVKLWPTPRAKEPGRTTKGYGRGLAELVEGKEQLEPKKMWPTPTTMDHVKRKGMRPSRAATNRKTGYLSEMVMMWPTPTVNDSKNNAGPSQFKRKGTNLNVAVAKAGETSGTLNPTWVEWLMGYPAEYTDLKDWETLSSRKSRKK